MTAPSPCRRSRRLLIAVALLAFVQLGQSDPPILGQTASTGQPDTDKLRSAITAWKFVSGKWTRTGRTLRYEGADAKDYGLAICDASLWSGELHYSVKRDAEINCAQLLMNYNPILGAYFAFGHNDPEGTVFSVVRKTSASEPWTHELLHKSPSLRASVDVRFDLALDHEKSQVSVTANDIPIVPPRALKYSPVGSHIGIFVRGKGTVEFSDLLFKGTGLEYKEEYFLRTTRLKKE